MSFRRQSPAPREEYQVGELLTEQNHAESYDMQFIIDQYTRTGVLGHNDMYEGAYMDISSVEDYESAQIAVAEADSFFESLPADIRADFKRGTPEFLEFVRDPANVDKLKEYGLDSQHLPGGEPASPAPLPSSDEPASGDDDDGDDDD